MQDVNVRAFQEESDLLGLRLFVDEQSHLLRDFSEQLEQNVSTLKQDVAAIVRRKRERSGIWSWPGFLFFRKVYIYVDTLISQLCRYSGWGYEMSRTRFLQTKFFVWVNKHDGDLLWCSSFSVIYTFQMVHACVKAGKAIEIMRYLRAKSLSTLSSEGCHREQISSWKATLMEFKNESMGLEMRPNRLELVPINEHYMHSGPCSTQFIHKSIHHIFCNASFLLFVCKMKFIPVDYSFSTLG